MTDGLTRGRVRSRAFLVTAHGTSRFAPVFTARNQPAVPMLRCPWSEPLRPKQHLHASGGEWASPVHTNRVHTTDRFQSIMARTLVELRNRVLEPNGPIEPRYKTSNDAVRMRG